LKSIFICHTGGSCCKNLDIQNDALENMSMCFFIFSLSRGDDQ
jgi:hypothetical protein